MRIPFFIKIACFLTCATLIGCGADSLGLDESQNPPELIRITPDNGHARWVGETPDGRLFFATYPYEVNVDDGTIRDFLAIYFWNKDGSFSEAVIQEHELSSDDASKSLQRFLMEHFGDTEDLLIREIEVAPFEVQRYGIAFGLIYSVFEGYQTVEVMPGNYMAFFPPWNGDYDT